MGVRAVPGDVASTCARWLSTAPTDMLFCSTVQTELPPTHVSVLTERMLLPAAMRCPVLT
eukprot:2828407-Rhodomonas_salina.4